MISQTKQFIAIIIVYGSIYGIEAVIALGCASAAVGRSADTAVCGYIVGNPLVLESRALLNLRGGA